MWVFLESPTGNTVNVNNNDKMAAAMEIDDEGSVADRSGNKKRFEVKKARTLSCYCIGVKVYVNVTYTL